MDTLLQLLQCHAIDFDGLDFVNCLFLREEKLVQDRLRQFE